MNSNQNPERFSSGSIEATEDVERHGLGRGPIADESTTAHANAPVRGRRSLRARLMTVLATLLVAVGIGVGTASTAQAAPVARAYVCFDVPSSASGNPMTEAAWWYNGSRWVSQATTTLSSAGNGCMTWNLGRSGYWSFTVASSYRITGGYMEHRSGTSPVSYVNPGAYINFGHSRVTVTYGR